MKRSSFSRPVPERRPVVLTRIAPEHRRGVMAPVGGSKRTALVPALADEDRSRAVLTEPATRDKATAAHIDRMVACGCIVCWMLHGVFSAAEFHHPRQFAGAGQRSRDWLGFGVCPGCHRGPQGIHGDRTYLRMLNMDEAGLLAVALWRAYGCG